MNDPAIDRLVKTYGRDVLKELRANAGAARAQQSFPFFFAPYMNERFKMPRHQQLITQKLDDAFNGTASRSQAFAMSPLSGKTSIVSQHFPAWYIGKTGGRADVMIVTRSMDYSRTISRSIQEIVTDKRYPFKGFSINPKSSSVDSWGFVDSEGSARGMGVVTCFGWDSGTSGVHFCLLVCDDIVGSLGDLVDSALQPDPQKLEKMDSELTNKILTRAHSTEDGFPIMRVCVATRWLQGDPFDMVTSKGDDWDITRIPQICDDEEHDPLGRKLGDVMWPERYPASVMDARKKEVGSRVWSAQFQQFPQSATGNQIHAEWIKTHDHIEPMKVQQRGEHTIYGLPGASYDVYVKPEFIISADTAWTSNRKNDESAIAVIGLTRNEWGLRWWIEDVQLLWLEQQPLTEHLKTMYHKHRPRMGVLIEKAASGFGIAQSLRTVGDGHGGVFPVHEVSVNKSKAIRASMWTNLVESGQMSFNHHMPQWSEVRRQLTSFPAANVGDGAVDAISLAVGYILSFVKNVGPDRQTIAAPASFWKQTISQSWTG